ncbi:MAG: HIT family protein [Flavobacteriales bacterium]
MATIFTRIVQGEIPAHIIAESELFLAFLDITPVAKGHTLVIPKREVDHFFDMSEEELREFNLFARDVAHKMQRAIPCRRIGSFVIGLEVPHAHMHLIPLQSMADTDFRGQRLHLSQEEFMQIAESIRKA